MFSHLATFSHIAASSHLRVPHSSQVLLYFRMFIYLLQLNDYLDQSETEARELERTAGDYDSRYMTHEKWFNELLDGTKFCLDDALRKCKAVRDEMEYILDDMNSKKVRGICLKNMSYSF